MAAGQNPVKADWNRLKPTKKVSQSQFASANILVLFNNNEAIIIVPAIADTAFVIVILIFLCLKVPTLPLIRYNFKFFTPQEGANTKRGSGGIGRHAGFRFQCRKT